jgi:hypothetical protein
MSNHFTFSYPGRPAAGGAGVPAPTEILVTEDHAQEAVRIVVRTLEFLRIVYCGDAGTDLYAVPAAVIGGVEEAPPPRRSATTSTSDPLDPEDFSCGSARGHGRTLSGPVSPYGSPPVAGRRSASISPTPGLPRRPYDTLFAPVSTLANKTLAVALHTALASVAQLPWTAVLKKSGARDANAVPFVLRVRLCKPKPAGLFGIAAKVEIIEEWEFNFVKLKNGTGHGGGGGLLSSVGGSAAPSPGGTGGSNRTSGSDPSSAMFLQRAAAAPTVMQHALGLSPLSLSPNDPGKLRDVLHFVNVKALQALDTFVVDELRVTPEVTFEIAVVAHDRDTACCHVVAPQLATSAAARSQAHFVSETAAAGSAHSAQPADAPQQPSSIAGAIGSSFASFFRSRAK